MGLEPQDGQSRGRTRGPVRETERGGAGRSEPGRAAGRDGGLAHGGACRGPGHLSLVVIRLKGLPTQAPPPRKSSDSFSSSEEPPASPQEGRPPVEGPCSAVLSMGRPLASLDGTEPSVPVHCQTSSLQDHMVLMLGLRSLSCSPSFFQDGLRLSRPFTFPYKF